jgi:hypothetical protein
VINHEDLSKILDTVQTEAPPASVAEMRAWCVSQGIDVPAKGRHLPREAVEAYEAAHA